MAVICRDSEDNASADDPLLPWLWSIKKALDELSSSADSASQFETLLKDCILKFKDDDRYKNDVRFLKIWFLYVDAVHDFESVFKMMEDSRICLTCSLLYEAYALFLESKGKLVDAIGVYRKGILRNAEPLERLKKAEALFLSRMSAIVDACSLHEGLSEMEWWNLFLLVFCDCFLHKVSPQIDGRESVNPNKNFINPWSISTLKGLLTNLKKQILKYNGYHGSTKNYSGKVPLSSLQRNKIIEIGGKKYLIKGCAGQGGFAQVFKAYINSNPDDIAALKIQKPAFPWEFYMYRQLDNRILDKERPRFGFAHRVHVFSDYSILVCDYLSHGTLQDAINSYLVTGQKMDEVLCIYYTIEMLHMLEILHSASILHGDFKPDNLLIRYARDELIEEGFRSRTGAWHDQGLCLVDWGRGIDLSLFPDGTEFEGDCRTSGFRCVEMQENKPWRFQVDTYGLCVIVHTMLHGSYMEIEKVSSDGSYIYQPRSPLKRYWNVELWKKLFTELLNMDLGEDHKNVLRSLRESFEDYMCSNPQLIKKLKQLLVRQRTALCSSN